MAPSRPQTTEPKPTSSPASTGRRPLRVALAQIAPALGDRRRNLDLHLGEIERAASAASDLVVFPELSLTGYFLRDMVPDVALPRDAAELVELARAAGPMGLIAGFVEETADNRFYNSVFYAQNGQLRHIHRKVYLPTYGLFDEARYFARGDRIRGFDLMLGDARWQRAGLLVCEDFWHLSTLTVLQAEGVALVICVANSPARGIQGREVETAATYHRLCRTYAQLLGAVVVLVNRVGFEDGLCFWGGSLVVGPDAATIAAAAPFEPALVTATIDPDEIRRERLITPLSRDERLLLTIEELQRIKRERYEQ